MAKTEIIRYNPLTVQFEHQKVINGRDVFWAAGITDIRYIYNADKFIFTNLYYNNGQALLFHQTQNARFNIPIELTVYTTESYKTKLKETNNETDDIFELKDLSELVPIIQSHPKPIINILDVDDRNVTITAIDPNENELTYSWTLNDNVISTSNIVELPTTPIDEEELKCVVTNKYGETESSSSIVSIYKFNNDQFNSNLIKNGNAIDNLKHWNISTGTPRTLPLWRSENPIGLTSGFKPSPELFLLPTQENSDLYFYGGYSNGLENDTVIMYQDIDVTNLSAYIDGNINNSNFVIGSLYAYMSNPGQRPIEVVDTVSTFGNANLLDKIYITLQYRDSNNKLISDVDWIDNPVMTNDDKDLRLRYKDVYIPRYTRIIRVLVRFIRSSYYYTSGIIGKTVYTQGNIIGQDISRLFIHYAATTNMSLILNLDSEFGITPSYNIIKTNLSNIYDENNTYRASDMTNTVESQLDAKLYPIIRYKTRYELYYYTPLYLKIRDDINLGITQYSTLITRINNNGYFPIIYRQQEINAILEKYFNINTNKFNLNGTDPNTGRTPQQTIDFYKAQREY